MQPTQYKKPTISPFGKFWLTHFLIINKCKQEGYIDTFFQFNLEHILKERKKRLRQRYSKRNLLMKITHKWKTSSKTSKAYYNGNWKYPASKKTSNT
jgi:hypothetical protein